MVAGSATGIVNKIFGEKLMAKAKSKVSKVSPAKDDVETVSTPDEPLRIGVNVSTLVELAVQLNTVAKQLTQISAALGGTASHLESAVVQAQNQKRSAP